MPDFILPHEGDRCPECDALLYTNMAHTCPRVDPAAALAASAPAMLAALSAIKTLCLCRSEGDRSDAARYRLIEKFADDVIAMAVGHD
mgnify:CR=1 FL=1